MLAQQHGADSSAAGPSDGWPWRHVAVSAAATAGEIRLACGTKAWLSLFGLTVALFVVAGIIGQHIRKSLGRMSLVRSPGSASSHLCCCVAIGSARRSGRAPRGGRNGRGDSRSPSDPVRGECPFASIDLAERDRVGSTPEVFWDVVCESSIAQPRAALQGPVRLSPGTGRATPGVTHTSSQVGVAADAGSAAQCAAAPESVPAERRHLLIDSARGGRAGLGPTRPPPPAYGVSLLIRVYQFASETRVAPQLPKPTALGGLG